MSTYENILRITDTLIQQRGFLGVSYADVEKEIGTQRNVNDFSGYVNGGTAGECFSG